MNRIKKNYKISAIAIGSIFIEVALFSLAFAQPSEKSLLEAWEKIQKSDSKTVVFEKIAEGRYKFKTSRFPFDGELKILSVNVGDYASPTGYVTGFVEIELVGLSEEAKKKLTFGYSAWNQNNYFEYDTKSNRWFTLKEYGLKMQENLSSNRPQVGSDIMMYIILLIAVILIFIWMTRSTKKQYADYLVESRKNSAGFIEKSVQLSEEGNKMLKAATEEQRKTMEESLRLSREGNELLKEILEVLKSKATKT